ncbi:MAG: hypothetical protein LBH64_03815, partial [Coriobacteriales bacterium]|nr:hypothetical protein [Coriobacteriales bacterium]
MGINRYISFNNESAFARCRLDSLTYADGIILTEGATRGNLITPVMDSMKAHNLWQRCLSVCDIPPDGRVTWVLYAIDDEQAAAELDRLIADQQVAFCDILVRLASYEVKRIVDARDFLLQEISA